MDSCDIKKIIQATGMPMEQYRKSMRGDLSDWMPLEHAAQMLLDGTPFSEDDFVPDFRPIIKMMRTIVQKSAAGGWRWDDPDVHRVFTEVASGTVYRMYADILVQMVVSIMKAVSIGTVLEIGAGSGFVTKKLCRAMSDEGLNDVTLWISDQLPAIEQLSGSLRRSFPQLTIHDCVWNINRRAPDALTQNITQPVLLFERFSLPYAGYEAIDHLAPLADILLLVDDLSLTGRKASFDQIYQKIGTQFLIFSEARKYLKRYFSTIHSCDAAVAEKIHSPVTTFTLAVK